MATLILFSLSIASCSSCATPISSQSKADATELSSVDLAYTTFAQKRILRIRDIAVRKDATFPSDLSRFLEAVLARNCSEAEECYRKIASTNEPTLLQQVFPDSEAGIAFERINELYQTLRLFTKWPPELLSLYSRRILDSIPDGSVLFAGSDSARFALQVFNDTPSRRILIVSQNAVVDRNYVECLRRAFPDDFWLPTEKDQADALAEYVELIRKGKHEHVPMLRSREDGSHLIDKDLAVMGIGEILTRKVFDRNQDRRFFVEESYVIPWMYPYSTPSKLIIELHRMSVPDLREDVIREDTKYWREITKLLNDKPDFKQCDLARSTFAKMRVAIAGVYIHRKLYVEAERALRQAIELYPNEEDANMRLAALFMKRGNYAKAREVLEHYQGICRGIPQIDRMLRDIEERSSKQATPRAKD